MTQPQRRQFLKDLLGALAQGAGTVVLASAAAAPAMAQATGAQNADIQQRAEELAAAAGANEEDLLVNFANRAFRNSGGGGGAFKNSGFANGGGGGGAFKNGGFANGGGGGGAFRNGAFRNR